MEGKRYQESALTIIGDSKILTKQDLDIIHDLKEELAENFQVSQVFRTRTEMEVSVLNDMTFPTPDAKYWQCQREQNCHFTELVMLSYEYRKNLVEIRQLEKQQAKLIPPVRPPTPPGSYEIPEGPFVSDPEQFELLQIEIEKKQFIARTQERVAKDRIREVREWHEIKERLIPQMEHGLKDVNEHQLVAYTRRFLHQYISMGENGSPGERQNLLSQLDMAIRTCISKNLIGPILQELSPARRNEICKQYGLNPNLIGS